MTVERVPEIAALHTFLLAADARSLSRAARRLQLSPAAVAKRLDNLEAVLGYRLLERGPRGVRMTAEGRAFYSRAERLVRGAEDLLDGEGTAAKARLSGVHALLGRRAVRSTETMLADIERLLGYVLDSVSAGIVLRRVADGIVLEANQAFCELTEVPREELIGRLCPVALASLPVGDMPVRTSTVFRTRTGAERALDVVSRRIDIAGEDAYLLVVNDVTQLRELELVA